MKNYKQKLLLILIVLLPFAVKASDVPRCWVSFYEDTDIPSAYINVNVDDQGVLSAHIIELIPEEGQSVGTVCSGCPGNFKDKPFEGMPVLWDLKSDGDGKWTKGQGFSPERKRIFNAEVWLSDDSNVLNIRGKVGMFSKTQQWHRRSNA